MQVIDITSKDTQRSIYRCLAYKRKYRGRTLIEDIPALGLSKGNRLEPSPSMPDVAMFETKDVPFLCTFWIGDIHGRVVHGNPLVDICGFVIELWGIDILHTWCLGPIQAFVAFVIHLLIASGVYYKKLPWLDQEDADRISLNFIKAELFAWYKSMRRDPHWRRTGTEVWNLSMAMLGNKSKPMLHAKAKESEGLLMFAVYALESHKDKLCNVSEITAGKVSLLLESGKAALDINQILRQNSDRKIPVSDCQILLGKYLRFANLLQRAGGDDIQKSHLMIHMLQRSIYKGRPIWYATWRDEWINGILAKVANSAHRGLWHEVVFKKVGLMYRNSVEEILKRLSPDQP